MSKIENSQLDIGDFSFRLGNGAADHTARSDYPQFAIMKTHAGVQAYRDRVAKADGVIELGIMRGGSCALFEALYRPTRHLAVDVYRHDNDGMDALAAHVARDGRTLLAEYTTSQVDHDAIMSLWGDHPIDMIVDDASHDYELTKASFNGLFGRLRPGGVYVIEDWAVSHWGVGNLTPILAELGRAVATRQDMVASIDMTTDALFVTRGPSTLQEFSL